MLLRGMSWMDKVVDVVYEESMGYNIYGRSE